MTFDPDIDRLFHQLIALGARPLGSQTVEAARAFYSTKTAVLGGTPAPMASVRDLGATRDQHESSVGTLAHSIPLRLYCPHGVTETSPALIYIHGGGFVLGDLASHDTICRAIAAQTPCRVIAIDYRLAPEHPFPAASDDVVAAVSWIARNASSLCIDPKQIAIGGDSAGGSLAASTCLLARERGPKIMAQVLIYPSTDSTPDVKNWPSRLQFTQVPPLTADVLKWFSSKYLPDLSVDRRDVRLSPLYATSHARLPPALVITAQYDPLRDEGKAYADKLSTAGVAVLYREVSGQIHGFIEYGGAMSAAAITLAEIAAYLRTQFLGVLHHPENEL